MVITIRSFIHRNRFWFYFRKGIIQVIFPIILAFLTFFNYADASNDTSGKSAYHYLYFYTSFILLIHGTMRYILEFIFSMCADSIILRKNIDPNQTSDLLLPLDDDCSENRLVIVKQIFKLRYSSSIVFEYITKICWYMGIDSPILIPYTVVERLVGEAEINLTNEDLILNRTLANMDTYKPVMYEISPVNDLDSDTNIEHISPKKAITKTDKLICDIRSNIYDSNEDQN